MFVVEDGTGLENANSYCDVDYFREYWQDRGQDFKEKSDEEIQGWLVQSTQYIDSNYRYIGVRLNDNQALEFPRVYNFRGLKTGVPKEILKATCEASKIVSDGGKLFTEVSDMVTERTESVGSIRTTYKYQNASQIGAKFFQTVYSYLRNYIIVNTNVVRRY